VQVRQGDVLLTPCAEPQGKRTKVDPEQGRHILAHGEVTGHSHAVSVATAACYLVARAMYLRALRDGEVRHEEHPPVPLLPTWYRVVRKKQYDAGRSRRVED
jgi:hypothetical protein